MSNLYKYSTIIDNKDKKVVDSNEIISQKIIKIREAFEQKELANENHDGFTLGIDAEHVEELLEDEYEYSDAEEVIDEQLIESTRQRVDQILDSARIEAEQILQEARDKADQIIKQGLEESKEAVAEAKNEGRQQGYDEGIALGREEIDKKIEEIEQHRSELDREYDDRIKKMEPELVDVLLKIFSEVTKVLAYDKKDMILNLVNSVMSGTEVSKNYIIKTNKEDALFLRDNKERIHGLIGRDINIEVVEDPTMKRNQCLIDTDLGIYDCSLDIQLENLIDAIKILACAQVDYFN